MTTPEQLDKWACEFKAGLKQWEVHLINGEMSPEMRLQLQGYLRRCQETEQAIKDARKQALEEARDLFSEGFAMLSANRVREIIRQAAIKPPEQI